MPQSVILNCPLCRELQPCTVAEPSEWGAPTATRMDFLQFYEGDTPLRYLVKTCAFCGYGAPLERWQLGPHDLYEAEHLHQTCAGTKPVTLSETYERAARCAETTRESARLVGDLWLKAAWACVFEEDTEAEEYYMRRAIPALIDCLDRKEAPADEVGLLHYLVGELYRRTRAPDDAEYWFDRAREFADEDWLRAAISQQCQRPLEWFP